MRRKLKEFFDKAARFMRKKTMATATSATLAERLDSLGSNASVAAERQLFALWGIPDIAIDGEFCDQAAERGLVCFAKSGSWDKLRGFDLPALLRKPTGSPTLGQSKVTVAGLE